MAERSPLISVRIPPNMLAQIDQAVALDRLAKPSLPITRSSWLKDAAVLKLRISLARRRARGVTNHTCANCGKKVAKGQIGASVDLLTGEKEVFCVRCMPPAIIV